jgi:hypothetical protein
LVVGSKNNFTFINKCCNELNGVNVVQLKPDVKYVQLSHHFNTILTIESDSDSDSDSDSNINKVEGIIILTNMFPDDYKTDFDEPIEIPELDELKSNLEMCKKYKCTHASITVPIMIVNYRENYNNIKGVDYINSLTGLDRINTGVGREKLKTIKNMNGINTINHVIDEIDKIHSCEYAFIDYNSDYTLVIDELLEEVADYGNYHPNWLINKF